MIWVVTISYIVGTIFDLFAMSTWTLQKVEHKSVYWISYKSCEEFIMYLLVLLLLRNLIELNFRTMQLAKTISK
jgi:hypothetical protein